MSVDPAVQNGDEREGALQWRQLHARLWAGRMDGRPIGTIEQGHGFVYIDLDGVPHPGYSTLDDAKDAATNPIRLPVVSEPRPATLRLVHLLVGVVVVVTVLVTVWTVMTS